MITELEAKREKGLEKRHRTIHLIYYSILVIIVFLIIFIAGRLITPQKTDEKIEEKILLNFFQEKNEFNSLNEWDLNVWLPRKNFYLENYYNLLLKYKDNELTALVRSEALCLEKMAIEARDENFATDLTRNLCNILGGKIDNKIEEILELKIGEKA